MLRHKIIGVSVLIILTSNRPRACSGIHGQGYVTLLQHQNIASARKKNHTYSMEGNFFKVLIQRNCSERRVMLLLKSH